MTLIDLDGPPPDPRARGIRGAARTVAALVALAAIAAVPGEPHHDPMPCDLFTGAATAQRSIVIDPATGRVIATVGPGSTVRACSD